MSIGTINLTKVSNFIPIKNPSTGDIGTDGTSEPPLGKAGLISPMKQGAKVDRLVTEGGRATLQFLRGVARSPVQMGAIVPSGKALARAIVAHAQISEGQVVVELGAGSGSFTRELLAQNPTISLTVFEMSADLAAGLKRDFFRAQVVALPAEDLPKVAEALGILKIDRVVGGLPWALWGESRQAAVLDAIVPFLTPQARMVTFHYVHSRSLGRVATTRRLLEERFEQVTNSEPVWANVPPAFIHISHGVKIRG